MSGISINMETLNTRTTGLKTAGSSFETQTLNEIDQQTTLLVIKNAVHTHESNNHAHQLVGRYLVASATLIEDIGESFFTIDRDAANAMGIEAVK